MKVECTRASSINGEEKDTVKRKGKGKVKGNGKVKGKGKDQVVPKAKGEGKVPNSKARHLEHSRAYHRAFKDAINYGLPFERAQQVARVVAHKHVSKLFR